MITILGKPIFEIIKKIEIRSIIDHKRSGRDSKELARFTEFSNLRLSLYAQYANGK